MGGVRWNRGRFRIEITLKSGKTVTIRGVTQWRGNPLGADFEWYQDTEEADVFWRDSEVAAVEIVEEGKE